MEPLQKTGPVEQVPFQEIVDTERRQDAQYDDQVELYIDRGSGEYRNIPAEDDGCVERQNGQCRHGVRASQGYENVVQVGLVGRKGRASLHHARGHYAQRIEHRNAQCGQCKGDEPDVRRDMFHAEGPVSQYGSYEYRHDDAQDERAAVADEHSRSLAENVVQKEWNERSAGYDGQQGHFYVACHIKYCSEDRGRQNAVARRKPVYAVDQVDGVDDTHDRENRQGYADPGRERLDAPEPVEIIDAVASDEYQQQHDQYFDHQAQAGRKVQYVVHRTGVEHDHHRHGDGEQAGVIDQHTQYAQAAHNPEKYGDTAHDGNRSLLQFAGVGVVDDALHEGDFHQLGMDPSHQQQRSEEGNQKIVKRHG